MCSGCGRQHYEDPKDGSASEIADRLCDDAAYLMFGVPFDALPPIDADAVISEVLLNYNTRTIDLADGMGE